MTDIPAVCACGRSERLKRDHRSIEIIKRNARATPNALAYIEELEALWRYAQRQADVWRGIASAMGYEPKAHNAVKPTSRWLLDRVAKYRAASRIEAQRGETRSGSISEADESLTAESGDAQTPKSVTKGA